MGRRSPKTQLPTFREAPTTREAESSKPQAASTREASSYNPQARSLKLRACSFPDAWCLVLGDSSLGPQWLKEARYRSASIAAAQPVPAAVTACRYTRSTQSPAANTPGALVYVPFLQRMKPSASRSICPLKSSVEGTWPIATNTPAQGSSEVAPVWAFLSCTAVTIPFLE